MMAKAAPELNISNFQSCLENEMSLGLVIRDIDLGTTNQVTGTPTLFINGHRVQGVKDQTQLRALIGEAAHEGDKVTESTISNSK